jgi:hypothetical protein
MACDRDFVGGELGFNVSELSEGVPLLVMLVRHLRQSKQRYEADRHSIVNVDEG